MVELFQIKFEFNPVEDRLLLRVFEKEADRLCIEYRLWLTRRFVHIFMKAIDRLIEEELAADMQISRDTVDAVKRFQHEAAISKADFSTSYAAGVEDCSVFSEEPLLVVTLKVNKKSKGRYILSLLDPENKGIHLTTDIDLLYTLQKMLTDTVRSAAWNDPLFKTDDDESEITGISGYIS